MRYLVVLAAIAAAIVLGAPGPAGAARSERSLAPPGACAGADDAAAPAAAQLEAMACLVDYARSVQGLPKLRRVRELDRAGALKLAGDLRCGDFSHTPCGDSFETVFRRAGYVRPGAISLGENLAWGSGAMTPRRIMGMWLASPGHRENLLSPRWREFGLAVRVVARFSGHANAQLWANEFGARA